MHKRSDPKVSALITDTNAKSRWCKNIFCLRSHPGLLLQHQRNGNSSRSVDQGKAAKKPSFAETALTPRNTGHDYTQTALCHSCFQSGLCWTDCVRQFVLTASQSFNTSVSARVSPSRSPLMSSGLNDIFARARLASLQGEPDA